MNMPVMEAVEIAEPVIPWEVPAIKPGVEVYLHINGCDKPITLNLSHPLTLGRACGEDTLPADVDLTSCDGLEKGVSRQHLIMEKGEDCVMIYDLNSTNGTYVNGEHLRPYHRCMVQDGAEIRLANLIMHICF